MNAMDWFDGAGDFHPPPLTEQLQRRVARLETLTATGYQTALRISRALDGEVNVPTQPPNLKKLKMAQLMTAYQSLHEWSLRMKELTGQSLLLAERTVEDLTPRPALVDAIKIEKRPARRFSQSKVSLIRIRLCKG